MGAATVFLSVAVAVAFNGQSGNLKGDSRKLSTSIAWQLVGEAMIGFGTLIFAVAAHQGWLIGWSLELQSSLRFLMLLATSLTTLHLFRTVRGMGV